MLRVVDSDAHVLEDAAAIAQKLPSRRSRLFPNDEWNRSFGGELGQYPRSPQDHIDAMDNEGITEAVLFPTAALGVGVVRDREHVVDVARAYNEWISEFCEASGGRLKAMAILPWQRPDRLAAEITRAASSPDIVGVIAPTKVHNLLYEDERLEPIWDLLTEKDMPVGFHATMRESIGVDRFGFFAPVHALGHPVEQLVAVTTVVLCGISPRHPDLRFGFFEAGIGWVPYLMERLDEEFEHRHREMPWLEAPPSHYMRQPNMYYSCESEERLVPFVAQHVGVENILWASDYPHWDGGYPTTQRSFSGREDLTTEMKDRMLRHNPVSFYRGLRAS